MHGVASCKAFTDALILIGSPNSFVSGPGKLTKCLHQRTDPKKKLKPKSRKGFSNVNYRTILKSPNDRLIEDLSELIGS